MDVDKNGVKRRAIEDINLEVESDASSEPDTSMSDEKMIAQSKYQAKLGKPYMTEQLKPVKDKITHMEKKVGHQGTDLKKTNTAVAALEQRIGAL
jgi:hypothetical protein